MTPPTMDCCADCGSAAGEGLVSKHVSHVSLSSIAMSIEITDDVIKSGMTSLKWVKEAVPIFFTS